MGECPHARNDGKNLGRSANFQQGGQALKYIASTVLFSGIFLSEVMTFFLTLFSALSDSIIVLLNLMILYVLFCLFRILGGDSEMKQEAAIVLSIGMIVAIGELSQFHIFKVFPLLTIVIIHSIIWVAIGILTFLAQRYSKK